MGSIGKRTKNSKERNGDLVLYKNQFSVLTPSWYFLAWLCMAASGTGLQVFTDDVPTDKSNRMNYEMYTATLRLSQMLQN